MYFLSNIILSYRRNEPELIGRWNRKRTQETIIEILETSQYRFDTPLLLPEIHIAKSSNQLQTFVRIMFS